MSRLRTKPWCNHYRGMHEKEECNVGVRFDSLADYKTPQFFDTCPCFGPRGGCSKAEYPTEEQLIENRRLLDKIIEATGLARAAIVAHCGGPWKRGTPDTQGKLDCPVCNQKESLHFSRAGYNGHMMAVCATENCVRWME